MVEGALYVLLHPCNDSCGIRMQLCDSKSPDVCALYLCVMHEGT